MSNKTFFITGANSGFGLAIATAAVQAGHTVIGTVRSEASRTALAESPASITAGPLRCHRFDRIPDVVRQAEDEHGPVDVLINNAGYGHEGVLEESPIEEMRRQFDVNVFGAVAWPRRFFPRFRARRSGFIVNVTSMGGMITMPGIAYYCGSKFALQGISEVMRSEMAPFGVHVTTLCPGSFRTDWAGRSMVRTERSIADYDASSIRSARRGRPSAASSSAIPTSWPPPSDAGRIR
jgi:short-subunit dehydrogenase